MLSDRAQILLKTLVERYIVEGEPVGSRTLSRHAGLELSPASIRNVMANLEEMGFVASPHTSAGRVPTPRGYRFFVDSLLTVRPLAEAQIHELEGHLQPDQPQRLISSASHLLSELTRFAGVVVAKLGTAEIEAARHGRSADGRAAAAGGAMALAKVAGGVATAGLLLFGNLPWVLDLLPWTAGRLPMAATSGWLAAQSMLAAPASRTSIVTSGPAATPGGTSTR